MYLIRRLSNLEELVVIHNELEVKSEAFSALLNPLGLMKVQNQIKSKEKFQWKNKYYHIKILQTNLVRLGCTKDCMKFGVNEKIQFAD